MPRRVNNGGVCKFVSYLPPSTTAYSFNFLTFVGVQQRPGDDEAANAKARSLDADAALSDQKELAPQARTRHRGTLHRLRIVGPTWTDISGFFL
jgi:hypothetical protein